MKRGKLLRLGVLTGLVAAGLASTGCTNPNGTTNNTGTDALAGGAVGTGAGALLGAAVHAPVAGAVLGGLLGASTGAAVGSNQDVSQAHQQQAAAVAQAQAQAAARLIKPEEVVNMTRSGMDEQIIINQIRANGTYPLDQANLDYLYRSGVSKNVIVVMQDVGSRPAVYAPPPPYYYRRPVYVYGGP